MNKNNLNTKMILIFGITTLLLLQACTTERQISVTGNGEVEASPDRADIYFTIISKGETAKIAQDTASAIGERVIAQLENAGKIETTGYYVNEYGEWSESEGRYNIKGYQATHSLRLNTNNLDKISEYLQTAVDSGINNINNIEFKLSKEKEQEIKNQAIEKAVSNAREKADSLAKATGSRIGKVISIEETNYYYQPYMMKAAMEDSSAAPPIQERTVTTQVTINVKYGLV